MNINRNDKRNLHNLTVEQKKVLFNALHKAVKMTKLEYGRMFTEPRKYGYRCKLWICKPGQMPANKIEKILNLYLVNGVSADMPKVHKVVVQHITGGSPYYFNCVRIKLILVEKEHNGLGF